MLILIYLVLHSPAIVMLTLGLSRWKTRRRSAKVLLIIATVYFIIGGGICGALVMKFH